MIENYTTDLYLSERGIFLTGGAVLNESVADSLKRAWETFMAFLARMEKFVRDKIWAAINRIRTMHISTPSADTVKGFMPGSRKVNVPSESMVLSLIISLGDTANKAASLMADASRGEEIDREKISDLADKARSTRKNYDSERSERTMTWTEVRKWCAGAENSLKKIDQMMAGLRSKADGAKNASTGLEDASHARTAIDGVGTIITQMGVMTSLILSDINSITSKETSKDLVASHA